MSTVLTARRSVW